VAEASAPASSANLGPGFDTVALALEIRCRVVAEPSDAWSIVHHGPERLLSTDPADDAILVTARRLSPSRPFRFEVFNDIPLSRGLGSSSAAYAAASMAVMRAMGEDPTQEDVFPLVCELEGHPDNAAAAVFGGLIAVADDVVIPLQMHESLVPVVAVPDFELPTRSARAVLPDHIERLAAVRNLARITALVEGLRTGDPRILAAAGGDELHEAPRNAWNKAVVPFVEAALGAGAIHAAWSGAGPSVVAFALRNHCEPVVAALEKALDGGGRVLRPAPASNGVR
jgi:homoserine kinase